MQEMRRESSPTNQEEVDILDYLKGCCGRDTAYERKHTSLVQEISQNFRRLGITDSQNTFKYVQLYGGMELDFIIRDGFDEYHLIKSKFGSIDRSPSTLLGPLRTDLLNAYEFLNKRFGIKPYTIAIYKKPGMREFGIEKGIRSII